MINTLSSITKLLLTIFILLVSTSISAQSLVHETLGGVSVDTSLMHVIKRLGRPSSTSKERYDMSAECWAQVYFYDDAGIEVEVCRVGRNYNIRSIRSVNSQLAKTTRGQGVGSDSNSIISAYTNAKVFADHTIEVEDKVRGIVLPDRKSVV